MPQTVTCRVLSSSTLADLTNALDLQKHGTGIKQEQNKEEVHPLVLAGLHACGDLSVNMLRFLTLFSHFFVSLSAVHLSKLLGYQSLCMYSFMLN